MPQLPPQTPDREADLQALQESLQTELVVAEDAVRSWTEAGLALSRTAAQGRAANATRRNSFTTGLLSGLFGRGWGQALTTSLTDPSNVAIAQHVADQRQKIADGKRAAQDAVRAVKAQLREVKAERAALAKADRTTARRASVTKGAAASIDLLTKLKAAHEAGLLTDAEYEEKRAKLVAGI